MSLYFTLITHAFAVLAGGSGGYLYGAKVKAKVATVEADVKADVKKI